ncbi:MAG: hypothetical protein QNL33_16885 [Akkermansiaceae bacterium]|jgi:hypothetical protein
MKPSLRDYLIILLALLSIFLCGYGIGQLVGRKKGNDQPLSLPLSGASGTETTNWELRTFNRLDSALDLSAEQKPQIESEVKTTSAKIQVSRDEAVEDYYLHLLELHDRILPLLSKDQEKRIKKDRKILQQAIETRFNLLNK